MNILMDMGHPADPHFFKHMIWDLEEKGHNTFITARSKDVLFSLLDTYNLKYRNRGKCYSSLLNKGLDMLRIDIKITRIAKQFKPDLMMGFHNPYVTHVSRLIHVPCITFTDTETVPFSNYITYPFSTVVVTPDCFRKDLGKKHKRFRGYKELAYLHPNRFTPDPSIRDALGVKEDERYVILRFVAWTATHDIGHGGLLPELQIKAVREFSRHARVFITSESPLPGVLKKYRIPVSPERIHDALYYASLYMGEGATMASECAVLGTPTIYLSPLSPGYIQEQEERYGLLFKIRDGNRAIAKGLELLKEPGLEERWQIKRERLLADKIDVTEFMLDFVGNFI